MGSRASIPLLLLALEPIILALVWKIADGRSMPMRELQLPLFPNTALSALLFLRNGGMRDREPIQCHPPIPQLTRGPFGLFMPPSS
jgi:hypothetical protein